jgi:outer membrane protein assembly factor BamB
MYDDAPRPSPGVRRTWMPVTIVVLAAAGVIGLWKWPDDDFPNDYRAMLANVTVMLGIIALAFWLVFFSGMRWLQRFAMLFGAIVIVSVMGAASIDRIEFQGNMMPIVHFKWELHERGPRAAGTQIAIPSSTATDFPEYRNRNRDGVVNGIDLDAAWAIHPPKKLWQLNVGGGFGGISVVGPSAITIEQVGGDEAVVCYDADTGKERWNYSYPALFKEIMGGNGPRTNPTIVDGDVYTLGATGHLARLDGATGKPRWTADILGKRKNVYWGQSGSPLVHGKHVIVCPGRNRDMGKKVEQEPGEGPAVVAYDRETGKVAWEAGDHQAGYSSPQLATIAGVPQVLVFDGEGLDSFDPETGKELWFHEWKPDPPVNVAQPLVFDGGRVFISSGYGHGSAMLNVTLTDGKWVVEEAWTSSRLKSKFTSPIAYKDHIYGIDESRGKLACLDLKGKLMWADGDYGNGQVLLVGDLIVVETETGKLVLVEVTPEKLHEKGSFQALEGRKNWNYLTIARGRAYVRNHEMMACYELPEKK